MKKVYHSPCVKYAVVHNAGSICLSSDYYGYTPSDDPTETYEVLDDLNDDAFM